MIADPVDEELLGELIALGETAAGAGRAEPSVLKRSDALVVAVGPIVVKAHPADTREADLAVRLRLVESERMSTIWLAPLPRMSQSLVRVRGRLVTIWPRGTPVSPDQPDAAPWEQAATLLARLHGTPIDALSGLARELPAAGGPARVARAVVRLEADGGWHDSDATAVLKALATLPPWARGDGAGPAAARQSAGSLVHGDWHLGQLVRRPVDSEPGRDRSPEWRLVDIDDVGLGDPAWDLARPAAFYAAGLIDAVTWQRFLAAYRACGGCAVPASGDPWPALEIPARALAVQSAALALVAARREARSLDDVESVLLDVCRRIVRTHARV